MAEFIGKILCYNASRIAPLLHVLSKHLSTLANGFITDEHTAFGQMSGKQCALASWCSTQIESNHRLLIQPFPNHLSKIHRRSILHIIGSSMKERIEGESLMPIEVIGIRTPKHRVSKFWIESEV